MWGEEEIICQIALIRTKGIGPSHTKKLIDHFGDAASIFRAKNDELIRAGLSEKLAEPLVRFSGHKQLEAEIRDLEEAGIRPLFFTDCDYPKRLLAIDEAPLLLFYRGKADLNTKKIISVVGTRAADDYGRQVTVKLIKELAQPDLLIVSGLAFGIDAAAHSAAMANGLPTVGILGHGFGTVYPMEHKAMANAMIKEGGLLTTFDYDILPEQFRFPTRNQWVAGLCDALVVVETGKEGGSMNTVKHACKYGKKIFAVPGRLTDHRSAGCNWLIRQGKAQMLESGRQLMAAMGWKWPAGGKGVQGAMDFGPKIISGEAMDSGQARQKEDSGRDGGDGVSPEDRLLGFLGAVDSLCIDELVARSHLDASTVALLLLNLEIKGSIYSLPGKRYGLVSAA